MNALNMPISKLSIDEAMNLGVSSRGEKKSSKPWIPCEQASGPDGKHFNYSRKRNPSPTVSEEEKEGIKAPNGAIRKRRATLRSEETTSTSPITARRSSTAGSTRYTNSMSEFPSKISPVRRNNTRSDETWLARRPGSGPENRRASCSTNITSATGYVPTSGSTSAYAFTGQTIWDIPVFKASPTRSPSRPPNDVSPGKVGSTLQSSERLQEALIGDEQAHETSDILSSSLNTSEGPAFQPPAFQTPRLLPSTTLLPQTKIPRSAKARPESKPHLSLDTVNLNSPS